MALAAWLAGGAAIKSVGSGAVEVPTQGPAPVSVFSLLGAGRTLAADWFWLETNLAWERHDAPEVRRLIALTVAAEPASPYFLLNGARMLAYDLPVWADEVDPGAPAAVRHRRSTAAASEALGLLERGVARHGHSAAWEIEMANICLYALGDQVRAAEYYERAASYPDAPEYAARIAARLREEARR